jgi:ATP-dependent exoDNAse (exonuclease V) beta subunit
VRVSSIHAFKGLESPVVILAELDDLAHPRVDELWYVALSRARSHLIVLGELPVDLLSL